MCNVHSSTVTLTDTVQVNFVCTCSKAQESLQLKVQSSNMDPAEIGFIRKAFIKESGGEVCRNILRPQSCESFLQLTKVLHIPTAVIIRFRFANSCRRWCGIFKGLSQNGGRADFYKNLCASLFNILIK